MEKKQKRVALKYGSARVDEDCPPETVDMLNKLCEIAYNTDLSKIKSNTKNIPMDDLIVKFQETGPCEVDVDKVAKAWNHKFSISRFQDDYRLVEHLRNADHAKVTISKDQAEQIIEKLKLLPVQSDFIRSAITYRSESNIISEIETYRYTSGFG